MRRGLLILILLVFAAAVPGAQSVSQKQPQFDIENELERLPTYGVFDFIGFDYDRGKVSLVGYAYQGGLKSHAANAVKRVAGVDEVDNKIELLPAVVRRSHPLGDVLQDLQRQLPVEVFARR